jgi:hypothetical protein
VVLNRESTQAGQEWHQTQVKRVCSILYHGSTSLLGPRGAGNTSSNRGGRGLLLSSGPRPKRPISRGRGHPPSNGQHEGPGTLEKGPQRLEGYPVRCGTVWNERTESLLLFFRFTSPHFGGIRSYIPVSILLCTPDLLLLVLCESALVWRQSLPEAREVPHHSMMVAQQGRATSQSRLPIATSLIQ